jgi:ATP-dependent RNA helicase DeaD
MTTEKIETRFDSLNLDKEIMAALELKKFEVCSDIQAQAIPVILETTKDVLGLAQTGTGKTAAFGLPLIQMIESGNKVPKAIILTPTRELAIQVADEIKSYLGKKRLKIMAVYGGTPITNHIMDLKAGCDIVVGTPGRVMDLIKRKSLKLAEIDYFVLDEADEMLNMGFIDDIETILESANDTKRVFLFSATMPDGIKKITKKYMGEHQVIEIAKKKFNSDLIKQVYFKLRYSEKFDALTKIIDVEDFFYGIVFCKTRNDVDEVATFLRKNKYEADAIHGDIAQNKREKILQKFRDQKLHILVATDVAARGIDVSNLSHVVNFSIPQELETYVHRIGRTGRAGNSGTAITFIGPKEEWVINKLERITNNSKIERGVLPTVSDLATSNTSRIEKEVEGIMATGGHKKFQEMTTSLITKFGPEGAVSALLHKMLHKAEIANPATERMNNGGFGGGRDDRGSRGGSRDRFSRDSRGSDRPSFSRDRDSRGGDRPSYSRDRDSRGGDRPSYSRDRDSRGGDRPSFSRDRDSRGSDRDSRGAFSRDSRGSDRGGDKFGSRDNGGRPTLSEGDVRLFIAKGTHDRVTRDSLVNYVEGKAGNVRGKDVKLCGAFSFMTVSKDDSKKILKAFDSEKSDNGRPVIEVAQ